MNENMNKRDYYEVLGLKKGASEAEIKSAYRQMARKHHPDIDKTAGAEAKFKEISEAYQVLSDPQKKKTYDQFGHDAFSGGTGRGAPGGGAYGNPFGGNAGNWSYSWSSSGGNPADFGFADPFDLFEQIFGMGGFGSQFRRQPTYQMRISFEEAVHGTSKEVELESVNPQGQKERKTIRIKVPAGVDNGTKMRFQDIDIVFQVPRHPEFLREGPDIFSEITVSIPQLVLGDIFEVNTVTGKVKVKVPPGTQPGSLVRLKGKGITKIGSSVRGDHFVRVNLDVPKNPSKKEKELYEQLYNIQGKKKGWF